MAIIDVYGRALAYEMLVAAGRESDCCSSSIGSWSEPCRPNWWLRPSLEHFEGKEERNSSGGRQQQHSFSSPKASFGPSLCRRCADGVGGGRQWTRSGPPLPPRPACCAVCLRRHCLTAAAATPPPVCSRRRRRTMYSARRQAIVCC